MSKKEAEFGIPHYSFCCLMESRGGKRDDRCQAMVELILVGEREDKVALDRDSPKCIGKAHSDVDNHDKSI